MSPVASVGPCERESTEPAVERLGLEGEEVRFSILLDRGESRGQILALCPVLSP